MNYAGYKTDNDKTTLNMKRDKLISIGDEMSFYRWIYHIHFHLLVLNLTPIIHFRYLNFMIVHRTLSHSLSFYRYSGILTVYLITHRYALTSLRVITILCELTDYKDAVFFVLQFPFYFVDCGLNREDTFQTLD